MIHELIELEKMEISNLIRELRIEKNIKQQILYGGLCGQKKYFQLENGDVVMDELLSEYLFSRLHVQYHLLDIILNDDNFWQKEYRHEINLLLHKKCWEQAECLLKEYEARAPKKKIHRQYVLARRAEICYRTKEKQGGKLFYKALSLTMSVEELEKRLETLGIVSAEELWLYFRYRNCENPFSLKEYDIFLERLEQWFLSAQIYVEVYFEAAYQYALKAWREERYVLCREVCERAIRWMKYGKKDFHLAEFYFMDAIAGMKLEHRKEKEKELCQQCKMAYYFSESFKEEKVKEKITAYCKEEFGWHIIA